MTGSPSTEKQNQSAVLVARIHQGDKVAEQELVQTYSRSLRFIIYKRCQNADLADDLTQDALLVTIQKARHGEIRKPEALGAFIRQVGVNIVIEYQRKQIRQATFCAEDTDSYAATASHSYLGKLHSDESIRAVTRLMNELNVERDRVLLWDFFVYEKSKLQICEEQEIAPEHFDRILYRARQRLRKLLSDGGSSLSDTLNFNLVVVLFVLMQVSQFGGLDKPSDKFFSPTLREVQIPPHYTSQSNEFCSIRGLIECFSEEFYR